VHTNKESTRELAAEAARWTEALVQALTAAPPAMLPILKAHVEEMTKYVLCVLMFMPRLTDDQSAGRDRPVKHGTCQAEHDKRHVT
jgi:hypothetical protein